jgi:hypothetical protein
MRKRGFVALSAPQRVPTEDGVFRAYRLSRPGISTSCCLKGNNCPRRLGLEVAFTDGAGRHWVRRAPTGDLKPLDANPVKHYGISRPLTYNELEDWPSVGQVSGGA